ncbi:MAG: hypothetical protein IKY53_00720 [Lachnospiraceae bacterium]|nr:hypothetical protein [Kiritimatiellia bacterium]MBR4964998.1 hypothetical protein [Lachnospiraceae bacterium]
MSKVIRGTTNFIDAEVLGKLRGGWQSWVLGAFTGLVMSGADDFIRNLSKNPMLKALGIIDGEQIDVDKLYKQLRAQAEISTATIDLPLAGSITLGVNDVDRLYRLIQEA